MPCGDMGTPVRFQNLPPFLYFHHFHHVTSVPRAYTPLLSEKVSVSYVRTRPVTFLFPDTYFPPAESGDGFVVGCTNLLTVCVFPLSLAMSF